MAVFVQLVSVIGVCCVANIVVCSEEIDHRVFLAQLIHKYGTNGSISYEGFERLYQNLGLGPPAPESTTHNDLVKNSESLSRSSRHVDNLIKSRECMAEEQLAHVMNQHAEVTINPSPSPILFPPQCLSANQLLGVYGVPGPNTSISPVDFLHLCPAIVYELDQGMCSQQGSHHHDSTVSSLKWLYALSMVGVISVTGLLCVALVPLVQKSFFSQLNSFLVALAVGTLLGDAFLHLIPHALSSGSSSHDHSDSLLKTGAVFLSVVSLFAIDGVLKINKHRKEKKKLHNNVEYVTVSLNNSEKVEIMDMAKPTHHGHSHRSSDTTSSMILFGDMMHNFMDGLAIGGAFAGGAAPGFATSVAVLIHELPHELGDFSVLLQAGMSVKRALVCNIILSVVSVVGTVVGLIVGNLHNSAPWIYAVTAGCFIYIALTTLVPEMSKDQNQWKSLVFRLSGFLAGGAIMGAIALFEHSIHNLFSDS